MRARASCALAEALTDDLPRAERLIQEGLGELPDDARFALDRVFCLQRGSGVAYSRRQLHDAITRAQGAQRALSQSPFQPQVLELDNLILLANAYRGAGQVREAGAAFEQASARLAALGRDKRNGPARCSAVGAFRYGCGGGRSKPSAWFAAPSH